MSQYSGPQGRGASRHRKIVKREQAEARNAAYRTRLEAANEDTGPGEGSADA